MKAIRSIEEIRAIIKSADLIAITTHINPDGDAIGSLIAFYEIVKAMGKETFMVVDDVIPEKYNFMPSVKHILNCERAKRETPDLLVVLDASTKERIGDVATLWNIQMLNIDHHISNEEFADRLYLLPHYAATGEIIAAMLADLDVEITPSIADALYLAIATDCGFFRYSNTTEHTLNMASFLFIFIAIAAIFLIHATFSAATRRSFKGFSPKRLSLCLLWSLALLKRFSRLLRRT